MWCFVLPDGVAALPRDFFFGDLWVAEPAPEPALAWDRERLRGVVLGWRKKVTGVDGTADTTAGA